MVFFPLFKLNNIDGFCIVHNFPPNDWEKIKNVDKSVWALYSDGEKWNTKFLCDLNAEESKTFYYSKTLYDLNLKHEPLILLQLRSNPLKCNLIELPNHDFKITYTPIWRATIGLKNKFTECCYQGEIQPFSPKGSLLTFHPFIQEGIDNNLLLINAENNPKYRSSKLEVFDSQSREKIDEMEIFSNCINTFNLDKYKFKNHNLPIFISKQMAGIPFGVGISKDYKMMSLEHTHPPASFVIHGNRFLFQKEIKNKWFDILKV